MIGLRRHTVRVVEHQPEWSSLFDAESVALYDRVGDIVLDIQHVGSTAVPGLCAKPILDIAVAVLSREVIPAIAKRLCTIGYIDRGDTGRDGGYLLVKESEPDVRTVHLHIVEITDSQWHGYLAFRDILRRDASIRERYAGLKKRLAELCDDRKSYTAGKRDFIEEILQL